MSPSYPKTCKAVRIEEVGAPFQFVDVPVNEPEEGEILIKTEACGICHSDLFLQDGNWGDAASFPRIPGHEVIGTVVAVGPREKKWKIGDRVGGGWHGGHDGVCVSCEKGLYQMCQNEGINGINRDGGFAEYCTLRTEAAVRIPSDANSADYAPLLCAGVTVFNGMRKQMVGTGGIVAIQGLGGLGHLALQYSRRMGYRTVALSTSASKKDFALEFGATDYIDTSKEDAAEALQKMGGAAMIVVTAPNPKIMGPLADGLAPLGKLLILAPAGEFPVNAATLILKGVSVTGWPAGHALDSEETISFSQIQGVKCMIEKFPFEKALEAIQHTRDGRPRFRTVIVFEK
ncbi:alcohol dehydrogenase [Lophiotrema nucula]|uniref:Alcohol dehydrogenase n=1 Tax=Lophiotrema nucula TaxID=690887 RepID=A0A6A5ZUH9_9PLEO|nr:alcohol dehydrogenase [Lophiotrema nucula]